MQYIDFLNTLKSSLAVTSVSGVTLGWYREICLEDEIELKTGTTYPACFIVPVPFDIVGEFRTIYTAKMYLIDNVTRAPNYNLNRINTYNKMVNYAQAFLQQLGETIIPIYPITINPIVKWDANVDGIYFEISISSNVVCL